jgi:hypothetical protein
MATGKSHQKAQPIGDLFRGDVKRITILSLIVCACSLTAWWAFLFWNQQHFRNLAIDAGLDVKSIERLVSAAFFLVIGVSIPGNFFAGYLAKNFGYSRAIVIMFVGFFASMFFTFFIPRSYIEYYIGRQQLDFSPVYLPCSRCIYLRYSLPYYGQLELAFVLI